MGRARNQSIDKTGLKKYLKAKGYNLNKLSIQLGYTANYLSDVLRTGTNKNITIPAYKYLCSIINIPEDKFIKKETPEITPSKAEVPTGAGAITPEQVNALIEQIKCLTEAINTGFEKITTAQNSGAVIQGKIYGEMISLTDTLGCHPKSSTSTEDSAGKTGTEIHVKSQYQNVYGGKK